MPPMSAADYDRRTSRLDRVLRAVQYARAQLMRPHIRAGYNYGASLAAAELPPAVRDPGALERYFDEHSEGPGIWKWRHYFPIYERHLHKFVGRPVDIVEIGVFSGGSLDMWRTYFGDKSQIYGVDIEPACVAYEGPGKRALIGDQSDPGFWQRFLREVPKFDIVMDDGGHKPHQQIATLEALLPHIRPGGVYLCEDILGMSNAFHAYVHGLSLNLHSLAVDDGDGFHPNELQHSIDSIHLYPFVTVIEKRTADVGRVAAVKRGTQWEPFYGDAPFPSGSETASQA
jgi:hypothetical protein